jgi:VCBS repeat protein
VNRSSLVDVRLGNGDDTLAAGYGLTLPYTIADVDRDGRPDILLAEQSDGLGVYRNLGSGQIAARVGYGAAWADYIAVSDLDGDRNLDVLAYAGSSGVFSLLRGEAGGTFAAPLLYATTGGAPMVGDLNGDARVDVATMGASMGVHLTTCR